MGDTADTVDVQIKAKVADLLAGLKEGGEATGGFTETLREFKQEATQSQRTARYFAQELSEMVPGAEGATASLKKLIAIGLEGFSVGAGIEATSLALGKIKEVLVEHEQQALKVARAWRETGQSVDDAMKGVQRSLDQTLTQTQRAWLGTVDAVSHSARQVGNSVKDMLAPGPMAEAARMMREVGHAAGEFFTFGLLDVVKSTDTLIKEMYEPINAQLEALEANRAKRDAQQAAERAQTRRRQEIEYQQQQLALTAEFTTEEQKIHSEAQVQFMRRQEELRRTSDAVEKDHINTLIALEKDAEDRRVEVAVAAHDKIRAQTVLADQAARAQRVSDLVREDADLQAIQNRLAVDGEKARLSARLEALRQHYEQEKELVLKAAADHLITAQQAEETIRQLLERRRKEERQAWVDDSKHFVNDFLHPIESAFRSTITSLIDGTKTFTGALEDMSKRLLSAVLDGVLKVLGEKLTAAIAGMLATKAADLSEANANIAVGATAVAAQTAMIPGIGLFAAPEAAAGYIAGMEAMIAPLFSARGGFDVPAGVNPVTQLHGGEMVLPEAQAEVIRGLAGSGGGGGPQLHFHGPVIGTREFFELPEVQAAYNEARRNGRLR